MLSVTTPSLCHQPLSATPSRRLGFGVPPSSRNPVTPSTRGPEPHWSHVTLEEPYPNPNPSQKPSRRWEYCACAAEAAQLNATKNTKTRAARYMGPPRRVTTGGSGEFYAARCEHTPAERVSSHAVRRPPTDASMEREPETEIED